MKKERQKVILGVLMASIILFSLISTYAFFTSSINNDRNLTAAIKTGNMALTFEDNDDGINEQLTFGQSIIKKFKIINAGNVDASLSLDWNQLVNTYLNGSLSYNLSWSDEENSDAYEEIIPETNMPVSGERLTQTLAPELSVPAGGTRYYNLKITLNDLKDVEQSDDLDAVFNTKFSVGDPLPYRYYILTVDPNGGEWNGYSSPQDFNLKNKETFNITGTPTRTGATFLGWRLQGLSSSFSDNTFTMGIENSKLVAQWDMIKYNLTLNLDGGSYDGTQPTEVEYGKTIDLKVPTKEGYTFAGWETEAGEISEDNTKFTMTSTADAVITAKWTVNNYSYKVIHRTMNVDGNGYTEIDSATTSAAFGTEVTPAVKTIEGFTSPSAKTITVGTGDNTVTYDYRRNQYTLTIDPDGGSYSGDKTVTMYFGATMTISDATGKTGHTFAGWDVSKGSLATSTKVYTMAAGDAKLTAQWTPNNYKYVVYHKKMNVTGTDYEIDTDATESGEKTFGTTYTPNTKSYTGFMSPAKTTLTIQVDSEPLSKNVVNYQYARNQYDLTIDVDGGTYSGTNPGKMYYGASVTLGTPTKKNYSFAGWTKTVGTDSTLSGSTFTMGSSAATVKATWTVKTCNYKVKHQKQNANDNDYTLAETEEKTGDCGTSVTPPVKTYTAAEFGTTSAQTITLEEGTTPTVTYNYPRKTYVLTIKPNGGTYGGSTSDSTVTLKFGQTHTLSTPTKTGHSHTWTKTGTGAGLSGSTFTMGTSAATVTATWTANKYTVTFYANGGKIGASTTSTGEVTYGVAYGNILPTPTYAGYNFDGWYTASTGGSKVLTTTTYNTAGNTTLYAHWTKTGIAIILDAGTGYWDGDVTKKTKTVYLEKGQSYGNILTDNLYSSTGRPASSEVSAAASVSSFVGWSNSILYSNSSYGSPNGLEVTASSTVLEEPHTLFAFWVYGCFAKNTLVYTIDGYRNIQDIKIGDKVYSYNENTKMLETDEVKEVMVHSVDSIMTVTLENGEIIFITRNHPVYEPIKRIWKPMGEFKVGEYVLDSSHKKIKISNITIKNQKSTVYNFEVKKNHNYYVTKSNILVHNKDIDLESLKFENGSHGTGEFVEVTLDAIGNDSFCGGNFGGNSSKTVKLGMNGTYGNLTPPSYASCVFEGYFTSQNGGVLVTTDTKLTSSSAHTLYARYKWTGCFLADTLIYTPFGYKNIQDIKVGDKVYSYNEKLKKLEIDTIGKVINHSFNSVMDVILDNGEIIHTTWNHPFFDPINKRWKLVSEFKIGDYVLDSNERIIKIVNIISRLEKNIVYNFEVKKNHNYYVSKSNILVHNADTQGD